MPEAEVLPRFVAGRLTEALEDTPVVVLQGARQVGKSTLAGVLARGRLSRQVTLDDELTRAAAEQDPVGFLRQAGDASLVVDEAQRVPELMLPLKAEVDRDRRPGRFLLTGSADLLHVKGVGDSLAGRAESVELLPLSQGEMGRHRVPDDFVSFVLAGAELPGSSALDARAVVRGGYPEPTRRTATRAGRWFDSYVARLADHDARDLYQGGYADQLASLMSLVAAGGMAELVKARTARDLGMVPTTIDAYLRLLRLMRLAVALPAWGTTPRSRVIRRPKMGLNDTGLSAHLAGFEGDGASVPGRREYYGSLVEQFVALELCKQQTWSAQRFELHHFRDQDGLEVDIVVELRDGRLLAIEVKSGLTVREKSWAGLQRFRERYRTRDITGVVLHGGTDAAHLHGWLHILPITTLWEHPR